MCPLLEAKLQNGYDVRIRKLPVIAPCEGGQVCRSRLERRCRRSASPAIRAMARRTVAPEHLLSIIRCDSVHRDNDLLILIRETKARRK